MRTTARRQKAIETKTEDDFSGPTFKVLVGQESGSVEQFTVHTKILTKRSKFLRTARKPEWLNGNPCKPVDLSDVEPAVFQAYLRCVCGGPGTLQEDPQTFEREVRNRITVIRSLDVFNVRSRDDHQTFLDLFREFGDIRNLQFHKLTALGYKKAQTYDPKTFATIEFTSAQAARTALEARDGWLFEGHHLNIEFDRGFGGRPSREEQERRYEVADPKYETLIRVYLLADKLQDIVTANMAVDASDNLFSLTRVQPGEGSMNLLYESTTEGDSLLLLFQDMWAERPNQWHCSDGLKAGNFPYTLLIALAALYTENLTDAATERKCEWEWDSEAETSHMSKLDLCVYHHHDEEHRHCSSEPEDCLRY